MAPAASSRDAYALRIQTVYRGYHVRRRLIWQVRREFAQIMEGIEKELGLLRLTLRDDVPQLDWAQNDNILMLRLPRITDTIFEERFQYPEKNLHTKDDIAVEEPLGKLSEVKIITISKEKPIQGETLELKDETLSSICSDEKEESEEDEDEVTSVSIQKVQELLATLPQFIVDMEEELEKLDEINLEVYNISEENSERESNTDVPPTPNSEDQEEEKLSDDEENADVQNEHDERETEHGRIHDVIDDAEDSHINDDNDHNEDTEVDDAAEQIVDSTSPTKDTIASDEWEIQNEVDLADDSEIQKIVDSHTKDQIVKELAWTRDALQQRTKYLLSLTKETSSDKP